MGHSQSSLQQLADAYLAGCFARQSPPYVSELAERARMPARRFSRLFTVEAGVYPSTYLKRAQLEQARRLLATTRLPLALVAHRSGFGTQVSFFRAFKSAFGSTPAAFRAASQRR